MRINVPFGCLFLNEADLFYTGYEGTFFYQSNDCFILRRESFIRQMTVTYFGLLFNEVINKTMYWFIYKAFHCILFILVIIKIINNSKI